MNNQFRTHLTDVSGRPVLVVEGEIDDATAPMLDDACRLLASTTDRLILDFAGVSFMDSMGLRVLVDASRHCASVLVCNAPDRVRRLLEITCLAETFLEPVPSDPMLRCGRSVDRRMSVACSGD